MKRETAKKITKYLDIIGAVSGILGGIATLGMIAKGMETPNMKRLG